MLSNKALSAAAVPSSVAIEDVFSTYLYSGNGAAQTITNGIDLAAEGGLVWVKSRTGAFAQSHWLTDTVRGAGQAIRTDLAGASVNVQSDFNQAFLSSGFSFNGTTTAVNGSGYTYASWTFRKAERFFDIVTWVGNGASSRQIPHNLGVVPGAIFVKVTSNSQDWSVYHRSMSTSFYQNQPQNLELILNSGSGAEYDLTAWGGTQPTATHFTVGTQNNNGFPLTYIAYLFAHDPLGPSGDGSDGLIACGSYTGNGSTTGPVVSLGWEPQWILWKSATAAENWGIFDNMRGWPVGTGDKWLGPATSIAEQDVNYIDPTATGFRVTSTNGEVNTNGGTYIYIAIRRGPMRKPTSGTQVFATIAQTGANFVTSGFPVDLALYRVRADDGPVVAQSRLSGGTKYLYTSRTSAEGTVAIADPFQYNTGFKDNFLGGSAAFYELFRRAPGFFDVVAYTGNGTAGRTVSHNLTVKPDMMIVKRRDTTGGWVVYHSFLTATDYMYLQSTQATETNNFAWNSTEPTASVFSLSSNSTVNGNGANYISYHFASLPGISKVGSYTGNGSSQTINCGFTTGARFILIKRTDSTGDWYVWDTARGIITGSDPRISLNAETAEVTSDDTIDPASSGFIVNQVAATNVNVSSASYIFMAIA